MKLTYFLVLSESYAFHRIQTSDVNVQDPCVIQIIDKYIRNDKPVNIVRTNEQVTVEFPFHKTIPFTVYTLSNGRYAHFDNTIKTTVNIIVFTNNISDISLMLGYISKQTVWNFEGIQGFEGKHIIILKQITTTYKIESSIIKMQWEGYLKYNVVIGFYDKSNVLNLFVWFPIMPDKDCNRIQNLEYIGLCSKVDENPFTNGIHEKLRQCPLRLATDVAVNSISTFLDIRIVKEFIRIEKIAGW